MHVKSSVVSKVVRNNPFLLTILNTLNTMKHQLHLQYNFFNLFHAFTCVCVYLCVHVWRVCLCHCPPMEIQRQFSQASFLLVPCGFHESNSGHHARQHTSLPAESRPFPRFLWRFSKVETWSNPFPSWQWFTSEHKSDPRVSPEAVSHAGWKSFPCQLHREDKQESQRRVHHLSGQGMGRGMNTGAFCSSTVLPCAWPRQHSIMCQSSHTFPRVSKRERLGSVSVLMMRQQFRGRQCVYCHGLLDCGQARLDQVQILGLREVIEFKASRIFCGH